MHTSISQACKQVHSFFKVGHKWCTKAFHCGLMRSKQSDIKQDLSDAYKYLSICWHVNILFSLKCWIQGICNHVYVSIAESCK